MIELWPDQACTCKRGLSGTGRLYYGLEVCRCGGLIVNSKELDRLEHIRNESYKPNRGIPKIDRRGARV